MSAATLQAKYMSLAQPKNFVQLQYVWIDGTGQKMRVKSSTVNFTPTSPDELPNMDFCGIPIGYPTSADLYARPVKLYNDPFRGNSNKIVLCETMDYRDDGDVPTKTNHRASCLNVLSKVAESHEPWFGIEQEYTLLAGKTLRPLGFPKYGFPAPQGDAYLGVGASCIFGRELVEAHYRACLYAGVQICGINPELMPGQWEYQIGPGSGVSVGDDLWMARYLMYRMAEEFGITVTLDPKPVEGNWNGSGAHCNFSTKQMRAPNGIEEIRKAFPKLEKNHEKHLKVYDGNQGLDNQRRLTGKHETSRYDVFSAGVADRTASVRISRPVLRQGCGYFEDRRPASNCDPYAVAEAMVRTICLDE